jgi:hypothetical protein
VAKLKRFSLFTRSQIPVVKTLIHKGPKKWSREEEEEDDEENRRRQKNQKPLKLKAVKAPKKSKA